MDPQNFVVFGLIIVLSLDLVTIASRSCLRNASLARLLQLREQNQNNEEISLQLMSLVPRYLAGLYIFQSMSRFVLLGLFLALISWGPATMALGWFVGLLMLFGLVIALIEWGLSRMVRRDAEVWMLRLSVYIQIINILLYPIVSMTIWLSGDTNDLEDPTSMVTEEELKMLVDAGQQEGILEQEERQMIFSVFQLGDTLTREIMVPRIEMLALDIDTLITDALDALLNSGYSRMPVFEGRVDNIIGILYAKDLLKVWREGNGQMGNVRGLLREPYFVPEAKKVDELLAELQHRRVHMAIVVDEYGGVAGVVTLEDIIEEIFGEIQDEYDEEDLPYQLVADGDYLFRGRIDLDDFNEIMDTELPPTEADTLSGFIYGRLGHVPVSGEHVRVDNLDLIVEKVSNRRIRQVRARWTSLDGKQNVES
jgi:putative hemolysin